MLNFFIRLAAWCNELIKGHFRSTYRGYSYIYPVESQSPFREGLKAAWNLNEKINA
jgi:hypothetical protein